MKYNPTIHNRHSIRLKEYDYAKAGAYYVTIVTQNRAGLFGEIVGGEMRLNAAGQIVQKEWRRLGQRFPNIELGAFVVMPNHIHGIITIRDEGVGATRSGQLRHSSSKDNEQDEIMIDHDGSPQPDDGGLPRPDDDGRAIRPDDDDGAIRPDDDNGLSRPVNNDGAIRPGQLRHSSRKDNEQDEIMIDHDGSPLPDDGGSPRPDDDGGRRPKGPAQGPLGAILGQFKSRVTKRLWTRQELQGTRIWQRNYYEHIIRNDDEHNRIHLYIESNPANWVNDDENTMRLR